MTDKELERFERLLEVMCDDELSDEEYLKKVKEIIDKKDNINREPLSFAESTI